MAAPGFATAPATLANLAHLTPRPVKGLFGDNYLALADMTWTQQFLPEVYEKRSRALWKQNDHRLFENGWSRDADGIRSSSLVRTRKTTYCL